jgi:hypothetical protein
MNWIDLLRARMTWQESLSLLGRVLNRLRTPGLVQQTAYAYRTCKGEQVEIIVSTAPRYTVVTINGIAVYFDRLTGEINRDMTVGPSNGKLARKNAVDRFPGTRAA